MKVKVVECKSFEILTEDGVSLGVFSKDGEWEGMTRMRSLRGTVVLDIEKPLLFDGLLDVMNPDQKKERQATVVKASQSLFDQLAELRSQASKPAGI